MRAEWRGIVVGCGLIVGFALWVVWSSGWQRTFAAFLLGAAVRVLLFGWLLGFDARSLRWLWGAAGEEWTAEELSRLGAGWQVFHDIPDGGGNWDHVVVGPSGVFAIDSKNLSQPATVDERGLRAGRLRFEGRTSRGSAVRMKELIERQTGLSVCGSHRGLHRVRKLGAADTFDPHT
jgi:Nuclease-related domain